MTEISLRLSQALADRYRLERELGQGGMATVYLAFDLKHDRQVAVKVLRPELAAVIGAERFLAEIKTTAALQHPHILPLFDSGQAGGRAGGQETNFLFYVMPYVEGESLRDRLNREKQLPVAEAIRIASEVASALDYAHRHQVIHRDIKPENILLHDGSALVADFGIALAVSSAGGTRMTETGMSLGTPYYMSPEQAMGEREIGPQSDVYALGAVTYEMLVGEPPFTGPTAQAIVAKVVTEQPRPLLPKRHTIPPHVEAAVLMALEKLAADRFASAAQFAAALGNPAFTPAGTAAATAVTKGGRRSLWNPLSIGATALAAAAVVAAVWGWSRPVSRPVSRYSVALPRDEVLQSVEVGPRIALSPDGKRLVYVGPGEGNGQLWLKERDQLHATRLSGTEGARNPFFSPDGRQVGFFTTPAFTLKVASLSGGPPVTLTDTALAGGGGAWSPDGYIYFDTNLGLQRIKATGGLREPAVTLDTARHEVGHAWPEVLPNGKGLLFRLRHSGQDVGEYDIIVANLKTREQRVLVRGVFARYAASGHLVYVTSDGKLFAAPFDQDKLALTGPPSPLLDGLSVRAFGATDVTISRTGTLVYVTGAAAGSPEVVWVERDSSARPVDPSWRGNFALNSLALSPDGRSLAVSVNSGTGIGADIWVKQLDAGPLSRLTFEGEPNTRPAWSPDGRSVSYISAAGGTPALYGKRADGSGPATLLARSDRELGEGLVSRDGRWIVVRTVTNTSGSGDILGLRPGIDSIPVPLVATRFTEASPALSPDGRWLAYSSTESGRNEVYVRPFPNADAARWQVSLSGGTEPRWAHGGRELFYRSGVGDLVAAEVPAGPTFRVGQQRKLFSASLYLSLGSHQAYDVAPGDRRFIMIRNQQGDETSELVVVENWFEELKAKGQEGSQ